ncbi:MAG: sigma factor-like helix-turn-helix DNA-binding protein [Pseudomonadota bacterium]
MKPPFPDPSRFECLTARERECLRMVLDHRTAKEMALEVGVSHHAVEKRLKRAREKLGAATSLEAARWYAGHYGQTVSGSSDLALHPGLAASSNSPSRWMASNWRYLIMIAFPAALAVLLATSQGVQSNDPDQIVRSLERTLSDEMALAEAMFDKMDRDGSSTLDEAEFVAPYGKDITDVSQLDGVVVAVSREDGKAIRLSPEEGQKITLKPADSSFADRRRAMFALLDQNKDGAIDREEFTTGQLEGIGPKSFSIELENEDG